VRVLIAEDQALLREGLARLFRDGGHDVVATIGDADGVVEIVQRVRPDLVVLDIRMPPTFTDEGARAARAIKDELPGVGVLVLSQHMDAAHVVTLVAHRGFGYLLKDRVLEVGEFLATAERVAAGGSALDPAVVAGLVTPVDGSPIERLSERERDVLRLLADGLSISGIARRLVVSERTVEAHVRRIFTKLDLVETDDAHRRVTAVLTYLDSHHP
jgi:DNA-binding NarL/FixJ family response regulator